MILKNLQMDSVLHAGRKVPKIESADVIHLGRELHKKAIIPSGSEPSKTLLAGVVVLRSWRLLLGGGFVECRNGLQKTSFNRQRRAVVPHLQTPE